MEITFSGLQQFSYEIIFLISKGKSETINKIEQEICDNNIMQYINAKYENYMSGFFGEESVYDLKKLNGEIKEALDSDTKNFPREDSEDNGLLLLLFIIISLLKDKK